MDLEQITSLVKSLSGIGIVVMLVYLALQLRQRNLASRFDSRRSMGGFPGGGMPGAGGFPPGMPGGGGFPPGMPGAGPPGFPPGMPGAPGATPPGAKADVPELPEDLAKQLASLGLPGVPPAPPQDERSAAASDAALDESEEPKS